jgi:alpha-galactosidase/6-phospho-beta-glucosidase family protein
MMKICWIGGGSLRVIAASRHLMAVPAMSGGEIVLHDLDVARMEKVAALLRGTPEAAASGVRIRCEADADAAIEGADVVEMIARAWPVEPFEAGCRIAVEHGWIATDNLSLSAAYAALHSGTLALEVAGRVERLAPAARILFFTNPIAILTRIAHEATAADAIGICGGVANHCWDAAFLMGWDQPRWDFDTETAGINHLSWIHKLQLDGEDFLPVLAERYATAVDEAVESRRGKTNYEGVKLVFPHVAHALKTFGRLLYSTECDGLAHVNYYEQMVHWQQNEFLGAKANFDRIRDKNMNTLDEAAAHADDAEFWSASTGPGWRSMPQRVAVDAAIVRGLTGAGPEKVTASYPNRGAVAGFDDGSITEYTMTVGPTGLDVLDSAPHTVPAGVLGVSRSLVEFQEMLADAIVEQSADAFHRALYAYPMAADRKRMDAFVADIETAYGEALPDWMR